MFKHQWNIKLKSETISQTCLYMLYCLLCTFIDRLYTECGPKTPYVFIVLYYLALSVAVLFVYLRSISSD